MARSALKQIQRNAHLISRTAGDISAASRGPAPLAKRLARRDLTRGFLPGLEADEQVRGIYDPA
jgi:hypothetical protein